MVNWVSGREALFPIESIKFDAATNIFTLEFPYPQEPKEITLSPIGSLKYQEGFYDVLSITDIDTQMDLFSFPEKEL
jgi:hypothetical protein